MSKAFDAQTSKCMRNKTYVFTDLVVEDLLGRYDELISSCKSEEELEMELAKSLFEFKEFERKAIRGIKDRFYKVYPYDYNSKMAECLDISPATLRRIINKK